VRNRRRDRPARQADRSPTVQERAVRDAEAIVSLAWAEELLRENERTAIALDSARRECRAASDRLAAAQHRGDPREIGAAHAVLEDALEVHRAREAAGEQVRLALGAVLETLARTKKAYVSASRHVQDDPRIATRSTAAADPSRRSAASGGGTPQLVERVLRGVRRLFARRISGSGQRESDSDPGPGLENPTWAG
jgi:hypothetical protein